MTRVPTPRTTPNDSDFDAHVRSFVALLEAFRATGGTMPGDFVCRLLQEHQIGNTISLAKLISTAQAFGFEWRRGFWVPMFQFDAESLALLPSVQRVRAELPAQWSGWAVASWFAKACPSLDGRNPVDVIDSDLDTLLEIARSLGPDRRVEHVPVAGRRPQVVHRGPVRVDLATCTNEIEPSTANARQLSDGMPSAGR